MNDLPVLPVATAATSPTSAPRTGRAESSEGTPAFEALLERLTTRAAELDTKSREVAGPEDLPGALDAARASLEDALTLGERLLEAYQAAQRRGQNP